MPESDARSVALTITVSISGMASEMCVTSEALTITVSVYGWDVKCVTSCLLSVLFHLFLTSEALTLTVLVYGMGCEMCHQSFAVSCV